MALTPAESPSDLTEQQALLEARRRWGDTGAVRLRAPPTYKAGRAPGRLARYPYVVGNGRLGPSCTVLGQGNSWAEAFEDAKPRPKFAQRPSY